jgi:hypothetical protein
MAENKFHVLHKQSDHRDVSRAWMWELSIPDLGGLLTSVTDTGITTRVKDAVIPGATIGEISTKYMGTEQFFAGRKTPVTTMTTNFVETEDGYIYAAFQAWLELIQYINNWDEEGAGASLVASKRNGYARTLNLIKYTYDGKEARKIEFYNAWPQSLDGGALAYDSDQAVEYSVGWKFDGYKVVS